MNIHEINGTKRLISEEEESNLKVELKLNDMFRFSMQEMEDIRKNVLETHMRLMLIQYQFRKLKQLPLEEITTKIEEFKGEIDKSSLTSAIKKAAASEELKKHLYAAFDTKS